MRYFSLSASVKGDVIQGTYVDIKPPGDEERIPSSKIASGENPVVECEEAANDAPQNLVEEDRVNLATAVTLVANVIHLLEMKKTGLKTLYFVIEPGKRTH
jgi:hypothetical protein